jgi:hydrogenase maturation protein HypF
VKRFNAQLFRRRRLRPGWNFLLDAVLLAKGDYRHEDIAASAQKALAEGLVDIAIRVGKMKGIDSIGISGGVAYNDAIVRHMKERAVGEGFRFFTQYRVPCGDGGISLGQAVMAAQTYLYELK